MKVWKSGRESGLLDDIIVGRKTIEGRLNRDKFAEYAVGDTVALRRDYRDSSGVLHDGESHDVFVKIVAIRSYKSFLDMVKAEDYKLVIPSATSADEAAEVYDRYYTKEDQAKYGVLAIEVVYDRRSEEGITRDVSLLLSADKSGHGMEHVDRVLALALSFSKDEGADEEVVRLAVLLHDVDDYKLFGQKHADELINAVTILDTYKVDEKTKVAVLDIIRTMGYNKYLEGTRPQTLEGMIVSDADMCDAIGAMGILRTHAYALSKGNEFFDKSIPPDDASMSAAQYRVSKKSHAAQHFFDKLLIIPSILMTKSGREEGEKRSVIMIDFLRQLFNEEGSEEWLEYLEKFEE